MQSYAKMAGSLDSNRKVRKAGRNGREVFLWVMRQVALRDSDGWIPLADVTDFEHVADQLMCSASDAEDGFNRAVTAALLSVTGDECSVVGWDSDWGRRPKTGAERQREYVARQKQNKGLRDSSPESVTEASSQMTANVTSDVNRIEENRIEERESRSASPPADPPSPQAGFRLESSQRATKARPRQAKTALPDSWAPDLDTTALARTLGVDVATEVDRMRDWARGSGSRKADWGATFRNWLRKASEERPVRRPAPRQGEDQMIRSQRPL